MKTYTINSAETIKEFFQSLYTDHDLLVDLDIPFEDFTDDNEIPTFTKEEAVYLNAILDDCFDYCKVNDLDVYELAGEIQIAEFKRRGILPADLVFEEQ